MTEVAAVERGEISLDPPEKDDEREEIGLETAESEAVSEVAGVMERAAGR